MRLGDALQLSGRVGSRSIAFEFEQHAEDGLLRATATQVHASTDGKTVAARELPSERVAPLTI